MTRLLIALAALLLGVTACVPAEEPATPAEPVRFAAPTTTIDGPLHPDGTDLVAPVVGGGQLRLTPADLAVTAGWPTGERTVLADPVAGLGDATVPSWQDGTPQWTLAGFTLTARVVDGRLEVTIDATRDGELHWPVTGTDPSASMLALPSGEGLGLPVADPFWNAPAAGLVDNPFDLVGGLQMLFWGYAFGERGVSYLVPTDIGSSLTVRSVDGRLRADGAHQFSAADGTQRYTVTFALTDGSPLAAALDYRAWLAGRGELGSLRAKIEMNPDVDRLVGAFHAYLWGDGRSVPAVREMRRLGLERLWLGYDSDGNPMSPDAVAEARTAGYLVGPYDTWDNAQGPATADTPSSVWSDELWPEGCVHDVAGTPVPGFAGRGCQLSSQALALAEPTQHNLARRVDSMVANGADSYFLDVDATGELWRDHSPAHPMTVEQDRANRLARMTYLVRNRHLVLGSETAAGWANQVVAFSHGSSTAATWHLWPLERDREYWGRYWPPEAPEIMFKPITLPPDTARAMFDPRYRLPLYQAALHDSVISLDRWELSLYKIDDVRTTRVLLAMLTNTPLNLVLDGETLDGHGAEIAELAQFFAPLHRAAATEPLTGFGWLTDDHLVQRTSFGGDALTVTANFGEDTYQGLPGGCVQADLPGQHPQRLCPDLD